MTGGSQSPTCCFCIHVKTGTSVWTGFLLVSGLMCTLYSTLLLAKVIHVDSMYYDTIGDDFPDAAYWIGLGNGLFVILIASWSLYGLVKDRAGFLLPLFITMLFDFLCTIIYIGSLLFYWPKVKLHILQCHHLPTEWKMTLLQMDDRALACIVFSVLFLVLVCKSYLITMVYRCYKHITTQVILRQRRDPEIACVADMKPEHTPIYKPPNYADIQKVPLVDDMDEMYETKPPAYTA